MTTKTFKAKFLKQHAINKRAIIANIEWALKNGKSTQGTVLRDEERKGVEELLNWCKLRTPEQPDLTFIN